jgi:hypothetical protein
MEVETSNLDHNDNTNTTVLMQWLNAKNVRAKK